METQPMWRAERAELEGILEAIAKRHGLAVALEAAAVLQKVIEEGRLDGSTYYPFEDDCAVCVIGTLALALGWSGHEGEPEVPGWNEGGETPTALEELVMDVDVGETPADQPILAHLCAWLGAWTAQQRALPPG